MKYVKKPIEIEAFRFDGKITDEHPRWAVEAAEKGVIAQVHADRAWIRTTEDWLTVKIGDYIIRGVKGELYPVRKDIFEETYEEVEECTD